MMELRSTLTGRIALTATATVILLFLALPIVVILVTSFSSNAFGSFPRTRGRSTGTRHCSPTAASGRPRCRSAPSSPPSAPCSR